MHGKRVKDQKDADFYIDCESWNKSIWGFIFKKEDKDSRSIENLIVFAENIINWDKNNFVSLVMYQYQVIIGLIIIQTFLNEFY